MRETEFVGHNLSRAKLPRIRVGGVALEYREIPGEASDATELVFLHSALGSARLWEDFPDQIADATGCSALIYSRRGHGNSDPLPAVHDGGYLDHEALSVLPAMLRARGVDRPVLIGHSDGATIALIAAAQESIEARALVLIAPHVIVEDISVEGIGRP
ncbi:MAG: alpha/beta fold hydrolase [Gemmatimonadaceae bacterium]